MVAEGRALSPLPPSLLGLGIGLGGRTKVRNWGKDVGYQNVTLWVPNIGTITSLGEGFGEKSILSFLFQSAYYLAVN